MFVKAALATAVLTGTKLVLAQSASGFIPLASQSFTYTALPYRADPNGGERGTQSGYNICNSTVSLPSLVSLPFLGADSVLSDRNPGISVPDGHHQ